MVPAAVRIAICQNRSVEMALLEIRRRLTRISLIPKSRLSVVVADVKRVHQQKAPADRSFRPKRSKKASHCVKRPAAFGPGLRTPTRPALVSFRIRSSLERARQNDANFGFGTP